MANVTVPITFSKIPNFFPIVLVRIRVAIMGKF